MKSEEEKKMRKMKSLCQAIMRSSLIIFVVSCLMAFPVFAGDYYVSPTGAETWPDCTTQGTPCKASNSDRAFLGVIAGDTVYFLDGTYSGLEFYAANYRQPTWNPYNSGTSGNPITFKSLNERGAELVGLRDGVATSVIGSYQRDYIIWDGFKISAVNSSAQAILPIVRIESSDNITINNCEIIGASHDTGGVINYEGVRVENSTNILIDKCYIHGYVETSNNHNTSGYKSYNTENITIRNCQFSNNTAGIYLKGNGNDGVLLENNWIDSNYIGVIVSIKSDSTHSLTVYNNVISNNTYRNMSIDSDWNGTSLADNTIVHNNTIVGSGWAWSGASTGAGPSLFNNIFYNVGSASSLSLISINDITEPALAIDHNIFYPSLSITMRNYGATATYTSLASWQSSGELYGGGDPGTGSTQSNPSFANDSGSLLELADFAVTNLLGRSGGLVGADVSLVGAGGDVAYSRPLPSPSLKIVLQ